MKIIGMYLYKSKNYSTKRLALIQMDIFLTAFINFKKKKSRTLKTIGIISCPTRTRT